MWRDLQSTNKQKPKLFKQIPSTKTMPRHVQQEQPNIYEPTSHQSPPT